MTLETQTPRVVIIGNGSLGPYSLVDGSGQAIRFASTSHVKLTRYAAATDDNNDGTVLVLNTDYSIGGTQDARTFTLIGSQAVLTSSQRIVAERVQTYTQDLDLTTGGAFSATAVEARFDKIAEFQQELKAQLARAPKLQFADSTADVAFPSPPTSATVALGRNTSGAIVHLTPADFTADVLLGTGWAAALAQDVDEVMDDAKGIRVCTTYAEMTALTADELTDNCLILAYARATEQDGGIMMFRWDAGSSATANGGTILAHNSITPGRFIAQDEKLDLGGFAFGMLGDGGTNDAPELQAMIDAAAGRPARLGIGAFVLSTGTTHTTPIVLQGINAAPGPGAAAQFHAYDSEIISGYNNDYDVDVTTQFGSTIEDLKFNTQVASRPMASGGGVAMKGPTGVNQSGTKLRNNAFTNKYNDFYFLLPAYPEVSGNYHDSFVNAAAFYETESTDEGAGGWFSREYVFGESGKLTGAGVLTRIGYIHVTDNMLIGEAYAVDISVRDFPAGSIRVINTNMENQGYAGIRARTVDGEDSSMLMFQGNEFSNIAFADDYVADVLIESYGSVWLDTVSIVNNVSRHSWTNTAGGAVYDIRSGTRVLVANNVVSLLGGSDNDTRIVKVGAQADDVYITGMVFDQSVITTPYELTAETTLLDINNTLPVSKLPSACKDLSVVGIAEGGVESLVWRQHSGWSRLNEYAVATVATDADFTLTPLASAQNIQHTGTLTGDRTITLSSTNVGQGTQFHITRTGAGAFNLSVGGLKNLATNTWCIVAWNGAAYVLRAYGSL